MHQFFVIIENAQIAVFIVLLSWGLFKKMNCAWFIGFNRVILLKESEQNNSGVFKRFLVIYCT